MSKTDYLAEIGALALASRIRRLLQRMHADGERVYRDLNFDFKPKWFPVLHLLSGRSPLAMTEIARLMCVSHPSMIATVDELNSAGLVQSRQSSSDGRLRELSLTEKGKQLCRELLPVWEAFRIAGEDVDKEGGNDFLKAIGKLERSLDRVSLYERIMAQMEINKTQNRKRSRNSKRR